MIKQLLCGYQTGADIGAVRAARAVRPTSIPVSGWMPRGFLTEVGHALDCGFIGAKELPPEWEGRSLADQYRERTMRNLADLSQNDFAVVFDADPIMSRGTKLIFKYAREQTDKHGITPYVLTIIRLRPDGNGGFAQKDRWMTPDWFAGQIRNAKASTLFVGGNRESNAKGLAVWVERYMSEVFGITQGIGEASA